jgi:hypothetical protein
MNLQCNMLRHDAVSAACLTSRALPTSLPSIVAAFDSQSITASSLGIHFGHHYVLTSTDYAQTTLPTFSGRAGVLSACGASSNVGATGMIHQYISL